jgi:hypothetical protein
MPAGKMEIGGKDYWVERTLQSTHGTPTPPEERWTGVRTVTKQATGDPAPPRQCKQVGTLEHWQQQLGDYWCVPYTLEKKQSGWFWVGVVVLVAGAVVLTVATGGAAAGVAGGWFVATAGGATALTTTLTAVGTVLAVSGTATAVRNLDEADAKGALAGPGFLQKDVPIDLAPKLIDAKADQDQNQWHDCDANGH